MGDLSEIYLLWWHWLLFGIVLLLADLALINSYVLLWFGAGAVGAGFALLLFPMPLAGQVSVWGALSLALILAWIYLLRPYLLARARVEAAGNTGELIGLAGIIVRAGPNGGTIRFQRPAGGKDVWPFVSKKQFQTGRRVIVSGIDDQGRVILQEDLPPSKDM